MPNIHHLPTHLRPRERLWEKGAASLELEELVAVLLGSGGSSQDVGTLSHHVAQLLIHGSVSAHQLVHLPGIGSAKAASLEAALQLGNAIAKSQDNATLRSPENIYLQCADLLEKPQEHLVVFYLSVHNQPIKRETVTIGTASASLIHPREVFRPAILHNASCIALAHNHPSGNTTPSDADCQSTRRIVEAGRQLGIELIDHVICAKNGFTSLKQFAAKLFF